MDLREGTQDSGPYYPHPGLRDIFPTMSHSHPLALIASLLLLCACTTTNEVVGHGPLQKRKYRPGWHLDLARANKAANPDRRPRQELDHMEARVVVRDQSMDPMIQQHTVPFPEAADEPQASALAAGTLIMAPAPAITSPHHERSLTDPVGPDPSEDTVEVEGPRYWNRMAIVSGIFLALSATVVLVAGGGEILLYLLTFALITGVIGLLLAIKHNERGKGIAIAGIVIPLVLVALVIAALGALS